MIRLNTFDQRYAIVDDQGRPTSDFLRGLNDAFQQIGSAAQDAIDSSAAAIAAQAAAADAQSTGDDALVLANTKVTKNLGPAHAAPTGTANRTTFATYASPTISPAPTQTEVQAIANAVQTLSQHLKAIVDDLRANQALTP